MSSTNDTKPRNADGGTPLPVRLSPFPHIAERRARAFELRKMGLPYRVIGAQLGISAGRAHDDVTIAMKALLPVEEVEEVRQQECDRLDHLMVVAMSIAGDDAARPDLRLVAVDRVLAIQQRRSKLLGLDMPTKLEHSGEVTVTQQAAVLVDELARRRRSA